MKITLLVLLLALLAVLMSILIMHLGRQRKEADESKETMAQVIYWWPEKEDVWICPACGGENQKVVTACGICGHIRG